MRRHAAAALLAAASLLLGGCIGLPDSGPVVEADAEHDPVVPGAADFEPPPPAAGASRQQLVTGFLDAMTAWPRQTNAAKEYLSEEAAAAWNPEAGMLVYGSASPPRENLGQVSVELDSADLLDESGGWRGVVREEELTLDFHFTIEDGEFRISDPPDALVVPATWFQQRFRRVSIFYFDPTAQVLVPEPVFVPIGEQLATSLVDALLLGPPRRLQGIVRSFVPTGLDPGLSVPVEDGVADIALTGDAGRPSTEQAERMLAQLAATLRQDGEVSQLRVSMGGEPVRASAGSALYDVRSVAEFETTGPGVSVQLFGVSGNRVVAGEPEALDPVSGIFGRAPSSIADLAVAPAGDQVAVVDAERTRLDVAPVHSVSPDPPLTTVIDDGVELQRPSWDHAGRLWVLDRRPDGAVVHLADNGDVRRIRVPGVTGQDARRLLVSRDGTRLAAVVRVDGDDRLLTSRVVAGVNGTPSEIGAATVITAVGGLPRIIDIGWNGPAAIAVLTRTQPGQLYEVDTVVADGGSVGEDAVSTIVTGRVIGIATSPDPDLPAYAVLRDRVIDLDTQETHLLGRKVTRLTYVG